MTEKNDSEDVENPHLWNKITLGPTIIICGYYSNSKPPKYLGSHSLMFSETFKTFPQDGKSEDLQVRFGEQRLPFTH